MRSIRQLDFWLKNEGGTPNDFSVTWDGQIVFSTVNAPVQGYAEHMIDVVATTASTVLQFNFRQDPSFCLDNSGLFDDGANIMIWNCTGNANQRFNVDTAAGVIS